MAGRSGAISGAANMKKSQGNQWMPGRLSGGIRHFKPSDLLRGIGRSGYGQAVRRSGGGNINLPASHLLMGVVQCDDAGGVRLGGQQVELPVEALGQDP